MGFYQDLVKLVEEVCDSAGPFSKREPFPALVQEELEIGSGDESLELITGLERHLAVV